MKMEIFKYVDFALEIKKRQLERMNEELRVIGLRELSKEVGVSSSTLSRIMNGNKPDLETAVLLCKWMDIDINNFIRIQE